jgi:hypothetical protein
MYICNNSVAKGKFIWFSLGLNIKNIQNRGKYNMHGFFFINTATLSLIAMYLNFRSTVRRQRCTKQTKQNIANLDLTYCSDK